MENDDVESLLAELATWAEHNNRTAAVNLMEAETFLWVLEEELGVTDLAELGKGDLSELLLDVYPESIDILPDEVAGIVPTVRQLLDFAGDTQRIAGPALAVLRAELDEIEPAFADAMAEPGLKEIYDLPDRIGPIRLPSEVELAAAARECRPLARARQLALWCGAGRAVEPTGLAAADTVTAAGALGLAESAVPELFWLAEDAGFLTIIDEMTTEPGDALTHWPEGTDEQVLAVWRKAFDAGFLWYLHTRAILAGEDTLDFSSTGTWSLSLFLARHAGLPTSMVSSLVQALATGELDPDQAQRTWAAWVDEHGEPAAALLEWLTQLGAVEVGDDIVRATPLTTYAVRAKLIESGVEVPLLPPVEEMTAADLLAVGRDGLASEMEVEAVAWLGSRGAEPAAEELLAAAAEGGPADRVAVFLLVREVLGTAAAVPLRKALETPALRLHAKAALAQLLGPHPDFETSTAERAWLAVDSIAGTLLGAPAETLPDGFAVEFGPQQAGLLEQMWRVDHPDVCEVLNLLGQHHPDKTVAKAARKVAFKAADRARG
ncbi:hypothetical protein ABZ863_26185 [Saccharomonospora sp. NPDC046836]|uniref:hypothetical protein n=1 Tax=Saccharomonospora sp. NPDC046836 TaxID=3156921 RepID=UPI0033ED71CC